MRPTLLLLLLPALAGLATAKPHPHRPESGPGILWEQHLDVAVYNDVAVSKQGFIVASTWLNEPEVAEVFDFDHGNKSIKQIGDPNVYDMANFQIAVSEFSTTAVVIRNAQGSFNSTMYKWNVASKSSKPDWTYEVDKQLLNSVDVSADGSIIAVVASTNVSYYEPAAPQVLFLDGNSGSELVEDRYTGQVGQVFTDISLSDDGDFAAFVTITSSQEYLTVVHRSTKSKHTSEVKWSSAVPGIVAISSDGTFVATANFNLVVVYKLATQTLTSLSYVPFYNYTATSPTSNALYPCSMTFSASGQLLAVGFFDSAGLGGPVLVAIDLSTQKVVLNYKYPDNTGSYENYISQLAISESSNYIAVASWGSENLDPGTEQIQVFKVGSSSGPVWKYMTPGSMFSIGIAESTNGKGVIVSAGGKHVHANQMGNGGDMYTAIAVSAEQMALDAVLDKAVGDEQTIAELNAKDLGWTAAPSQRFAGQTLRDAQKLLRTHVKEPRTTPRHKTAGKRKASSASAAAAAPIPAAFDARQTWPNCIGPIRDQGQCGSCWAFGAVESFGDRYCIAKKATSPVILSPQYMIACDTQDGGCNGGWLLYAWEFLASPGVVSDACYPYSITGTCVNQCTSRNGTFQHYRAISSSIVELQGVAAMQAEIMQNGPIEAAFNVYSDFMNYQSGIYQRSPSAIFLGGHAIKVLGWGSTGGVDYWIVANSWGTDWGMNGYFYIRRGTDECYLESNAITGKPQV